jgi:hypothetical protein
LPKVTFKRKLSKLAHIYIYQKGPLDWLMKISLIQQQLKLPDKIQDVHVHKYMPYVTQTWQHVLISNSLLEVVVSCMLQVNFYQSYWMCYTLSSHWIYLW